MPSALLQDARGTAADRAAVCDAADILTAIELRRALSFAGARLMPSTNALCRMPDALCLMPYTNLLPLSSDARSPSAGPQYIYVYTYIYCSRGDA
jgi:hypothetical protein